jgi:radical SAM superfamily enzyme YgiQ (UPF0313 family)
MKIHLILAPPTFVLRHGDMFKGVGPPLGLLYIAAYVNKYGPSATYDIKVTDGVLEGFENTVDIICNFKADVIGVSAITHTILGAYKLINIIKGKLPESKIIIGGPHATALPEEAFERSLADFVVIGEGEETFKELVCYFERENESVEELKQINGICFKHENETIITKPRKFIADLDTIPFPARHLIDMHRYKGPPMSRRQKSTILLGSRGCPFSCTFCSNPVWKTSTPTYRCRSPQNIANELQELKNQGYNEFFDQSDEFNTNLQHAKDVSKEIISRNLNITLKCNLRSKPIDEDLASLMKEAGFWYVHVGIESGNEETLQGINKKVNLQDAERCCEILKRNGIKIWGLFMYFNIWEKNGQLCFEDYNQSLNTLEYAKKLYKKRLINFFGGTITTPIPGSKLWDISIRHNLIKEECLGNYDLWFFKKTVRLISRIPGVPESDIFKLHQKTYKFTVRSLLRERAITFSNFSYAFIRLTYFLKKGSLLLINRLFGALDEAKPN